MFKITLILAAIAVGVANSIPAYGESNVLVQVVTPQEMDSLLKQNPQALLIKPEVSQKSALMSESLSVIRYTLGSRVSGDRIVAADAGNNSWATPQDVRLTISYPKSGTGAIVTFFIVEVNQSNNSGRAYVIAGGIGQRYISVVVEAQSTLWFNWATNIYGI